MVRDVIRKSRERVPEGEDAGSGPIRISATSCAHNGDAAERVARSLFVYVEKCLDERVVEVMGRGYEPLERAFEPLVPV